MKLSRVLHVNAIPRLTSISLLKGGGNKMNKAQQFPYFIDLALERVRSLNLMGSTFDLTITVRGI
jgi:hypothetical protein